MENEEGVSELKLGSRIPDQLERWKKEEQTGRWTNAPQLQLLHWQFLILNITIHIKSLSIIPSIHPSIQSHPSIHPSPERSPQTLAITFTLATHPI